MRCDSLTFISALGLPLLLAALNAGADPPKKGRCMAQSKNNVILITLDGVRWQDMLPNRPDPRMLSRLPPELREQPLAPSMRKLFDEKGVILGDEHSSTNPSIFQVSNDSNISLPGYQAILSGREGGACVSNECGPVKERTLPERLIQERHLPPEKVPVIASWTNVKDAAISLATSSTSAGQCPYVNAGPQEAIATQNTDLVKTINALQRQDPPPHSRDWQGVRKDRYTGLQALERFKECPEFMFVSFNDTDSWGHADNYEQYIRSIRDFDHWYQQLEAKMAVHGYGRNNTTIIITTDHGRGDDPNRFRYHDKNVPESNRTWLFALGPYVTKKAKSPSPAKTNYHQASIRPSIEALMGLCPTQCPKCGVPIPELVGDLNWRVFCKH
ncbi:alkaline phosphatase family protein [Bdellovibrionota bacterium FG-1]